MAFRRDVLKQIGGFDCALGAGTVASGGEDTAALSTVLLTGGTIVYQPTAIIHHYHRKDYGALRSNLRGYGRGLTSFYASMLLHRPGGTAELLRLLVRLRWTISRAGADGSMSSAMTFRVICFGLTE